MAKDPDDRPPSAADLVAQLETALGPTARTGVATPAPAPPTPMPVAAALPARQAPRAPRPRAAAVPLPPRRPAPEDPPPVRASRSRSRTGVLAALAALLLVAGAAIAAVTSGGGDEPESAADRPATTAERKPAAKKKRKQPTTTASSAPASQSETQDDVTEEEPAPVPAATGSVPSDARAIQASAHNLIGQGDYGGAIAQLRGLVDRCPVAETDPCAYAWFDLGFALRRAGDPAGAIPVLEHRLTNPDQAGTVQAELDAARAEAGTAGDDGTGKKDKD
jgi:hypothetical protein